MERERPLIAGVLINRLKHNIKLQCDASVQYALPERKKRLFYKDLEIDSPYNTYKNFGLPPGPICNPGRTSLKAAKDKLQADRQALDNLRTTVEQLRAKGFNAVRFEYGIQDWKADDLPVAVGE